MIAETLPYSISPDWLLRGGYRALVVYRTDTQEAIVTRSVRPVAFAEEPETRQLADGTIDDVRRVRSVAPEVASWPAVAALRRWAAEVLPGPEPRVLVRAALIASGRSPHLIWNEPVPVALRAFNEGRGTLSGDRLVLHSSRYDAAVVSTPDLFGATGAWAGGATQVLPVPGLTVYGAGSFVNAIGRGGEFLGGADDGVPYVLPPGTWRLYTESAARASVLTRAPAPPPPLAALRDSDGFTLADSDGNTLTG